VTTLPQLAEYLEARWRALSPESKRILGLDNWEHRQMVILSWTADYWERRAKAAEQQK
jgi:hypothetical protein